MVIGRSRMVRWWLCSLMLLLALPSWAATITVKSDRNPVAMNESFRLIFEADGRVDDDPDFKVLEQSFDIRSQSQGTTMQIINGQVSQARQWTLVLMPKRSGRLVVPPVSFGKDKSQSLVVGVTEQAAATDADSNSALFIEVSAKSAMGEGEAYVQSQVVYNVRFFRAVNVANASLSEPVISDADAVIEKLGDDREFETTRNGRRYVVLERNYAIFPQQSGALTIAPVTFEGQVVNRSRGMFDVFEQGGQIRRVRSDEVSLDIKPVPVAEDAQQWLPAREVRLIEEWPEGVDLTQAVTAGEPITWTLTLMADGLTAAQLPDMTPTMPEGIKAYPDQARQINDKKQETLIGVRQEKIALIPTQTGEYQLPAINIPWWNSQTGKREVVSLPARKLIVTASQVTDSGVSDSPVTPVTVAGDASPVERSATSDNRWPVISGLLGLGWLLTALAWFMTRRKGGGNRAVQDDIAPLDFSVVKKAVQLACDQNDATAAKAALLSWGAMRWPEKPPGSLAEIAQRTVAPLSDEVMSLNCRLYSRTGSVAGDAWVGAELWAAFTKESSSREAAPSVAGETLAPMYP